MLELRPWVDKARAVRDPSVREIGVKRKCRERAFAAQG